MGERDWPGALGAFAEAGRLAPGRLVFALRRIEAAVRTGTADAELARLTLAASLDPLNVVALAAHGTLLWELGREQEGIDALAAAALLAPDDAGIHALLGTRLAGAERLAEAEAALRRAIVLGSDEPNLRNTLGAVLMRRCRHAEAYPVLRALIDEAGESAVLLCNLASTAVSLGRQEESLATVRRAIALDPEAIMPRRTLCNILPYCDGIHAAELLAEARATAERLPRGASEPFGNGPDPARRLRVALLGLLRIHPVGWLTVAAFEALDPARFALIGLPNRAAEDSIAQRFRAACTEWHEVGQLADLELAKEIRQLGIDIVIDLGGYGDSGRMSVLAYRAAPVQVKWVGMQSLSTGIAEMDWFVTDRWETPDGYERFYSERLLGLPDGYVCYSPPAYAPDVGPLPALRKGRVTFGCFNNIAKITPRVIAAWSRILARVPGACLLLKAVQFDETTAVESITAQFARCGIGSERLIFKGRSPHREFLADYNAIDLQLDPFPYCGGLTTCEALWMGVPTLTLPGEAFSSRHSLSHLSNVGLADWVAKDGDDYERLAIAWAQNLEALASLRLELRRRVANSPLCDAKRFGRGFCRALRFAWSEWCRMESERHPGVVAADPGRDD